MRRNNHLISLLLFSGLLTLVICCKKESNDKKQDSNAARQNSGRGPEQAYPDVHGETISFKYGNDSIHLEKKGDKYVWFGDVVLDQPAVDAMRQRGSSMNERTFTGNPYALWPSAHVFYTIQAGFTAAEQTAINNAITEWQNNTPLVFILRTNQANYIKFVPGALHSGLFSDVIGMKGGAQTINLETGQFGAGQVMHEIGHAIGFFHEQSRGDRNIFITVNYNNCVPHDNNTIYQFQTYYESGQSGSQIGTFDFGSIMLYGSFDFSDNIHPVMTTVGGQVFFSQRFGLSAGDIQTANYLYNPPTFVRVTYVPTTLIDEVDYVYSAGDVYLDLYTDATATTRANLQDQLILNTVSTSTPDCMSYVNSPNTIVVPPGPTSQIWIGSYFNQNTYDSQENPLSCSSSYIGLSPGVGYRIF